MKYMQKMQKRGVFTLFGAMLLAASPVMAQNLSDVPQIPGPYYGVADTPAVYFVNFLFLYFANPAIAANMPAYRAPVPPEVANCLLAHPDGCKFKDFEHFFNGQNACSDGNGGDKCHFDSQCEVDPAYQRLAPPDSGSPAQVNEPLGAAKASVLAQSLRLDNDDKHILTDTEYQCLIGTPGLRSDAQTTIVECIADLTNTTGNGDPALASYGLDLDNPLDPDVAVVRSACAKEAPCLRFNGLLVGPVEDLAKTCGFGDKLARLFVQTPIVRFADRGNVCQSSSIASTNMACLAKTTRK